MSRPEQRTAVVQATASRLPEYASATIANPQAGERAMAPLDEAIDQVRGA
jgi:hypothetical protein